MTVKKALVLSWLGVFGWILCVFFLLPVCFRGPVEAGHFFFPEGWSFLSHTSAVNLISSSLNALGYSAFAGRLFCIPYVADHTFERLEILYACVLLANLTLSLLDFSSPQATSVQPTHLCCPCKSFLLTLWACLPELHSALQHSSASELICPSLTRARPQVTPLLT